MTWKKRFMGAVEFLFFAAVGLLPGAALGAPCSVLVVMSYDPDYQWVREVREGIESVLEGHCDRTYFYMDTKRNPAGGPQKAAEAYARYRELQPDGVIAADDNAQSMFVVPYLKDKVETPVMFCGVNAEPEAYGYPASNVSGIIERFHVSQSLALATQLLPSIKTFAYLVYDSPTGRAILQEVKSKEHTLPLKFVAAETPKTLAETLTAVRLLKSRCDVLFIPTMQGVIGADGRALDDREAIPILAKTFGKPIVGGSSINIGYGILCGVMEAGQEQGTTAAHMLLQALAGDRLSEMPITRNRRGRTMVNVTVMKAFGIKPRPVLLKGAEIVETKD